MKTRDCIRFWLNDELIELREVKADATLLDYLRLARSLRGTKEGCAEGDCGACTVLIGRLDGEKLIYESVNSCIRFVGSLDGTHVVTIEHLRGKEGTLHPVQQAMVEHHGSQCGFCTPGFVMSLYAMWMSEPKASVATIEQHLQGNLCRCTGYQPIIKAALSISEHGKLESDFLVAERASIAEKLLSLADDALVNLGDEIFAPATTDQFADIYAQHPNATIVAGSTDVGLWVTKFMRDISPAIFTNRLSEFRKVEVDDGVLRIKGGASYTELLPIIGEHMPQLSRFWRRIGGEQVRNMGTIGGNIANGSPIGDTPPPLIAMGAKIILRKGDERRELPLEDFFIEYGKQDRAPGELVEEIIVPLPNEDEIFAAYKISKRRDEDISAVCAAFNIQVEDGRIASAVIAFGGMAGTPKRATEVEKVLVGAPWSERTILDAKAFFEKDYTPLTDWRASAPYRLEVAQNLLERFYFEHADENAVNLDELHQAGTLEVLA